jgi:hypothetical protein
MTEWSFDIEEAPRGTWSIVSQPVGENRTRNIKVFTPDLIIAAANGGIVTISRWVPDKLKKGEKRELRRDEGRWMMFTREVPPLAWMPMPKHPDAK